MPGDAMKKLIAITAAVAALTGPVYAQSAKEKTPLQLEEQQRQTEREKIEQQYNTALKKTGKTADTPAVIDPWANMRGTTDAKAKR